MWLWLLPFIAYATKTQDKEETCLVLAIKAATERATEIFEYNEKVSLGEDKIKSNTKQRYEGLWTWKTQRRQT